MVGEGEEISHREGIVIEEDLPLEVTEGGILRLEGEMAAGDGEEGTVSLLPEEEGEEGDLITLGNSLSNYLKHKDKRIRLS